MSITRRLFLRNTAAAGAVGVTLATPAVADAVSQMSAQERYDFHLAELKKAAEELDPMLGSWTCFRREPEDEGGCCVIVTAYRRTGKYEGDGAYEGGREKPLGGFTRYQVRLLKTRIDGHRSFDVRTSMDRMVLNEPRLNTFVRAKLGELS